MALKHVQQTYEAYGKRDPLYAVLSHRNAKGNRWDPDRFFALGRREIAEALSHLEDIGIQVKRGRSLDFGCGAGRLTQALAGEFEEAVGVDISSSMIEFARRYNRHGERCRYLVNATDDLALLDDGGFDFIYSNMSLQHSPPEASSKYIAEFFRILRPGGVTLFQIPSGKRHDPGTLGKRWYDFRRGALRRFWKRLRGKPPVEIHYINEDIVKEIIHANGGRLVEARKKGNHRRWRVSMHYTAVRR